MILCYSCLKFNDVSTNVEFCEYCKSQNVEMVKIMRICRACGEFTETDCSMCNQPLCSDVTSCPICPCWEENENEGPGNEVRILNE